MLNFFLWLQLDVLEYIHSKEYIHADIKASNLLVGHKAGTENQVFLVDFGLACRYAYDGKHKEYKYDQRKAHDGTIEFTSRDAHIGGGWKLDLVHFIHTSKCMSFTSKLSLNPVSFFPISDSVCITELDSVIDWIVHEGNCKRVCF